jgi:O-antigen ligase
VLLEEALDRCPVSFKAFVKLDDPVLEDHLLVAPLGLEFSSTVQNKLVEGKRRYLLLLIALTLFG